MKSKMGKLHEDNRNIRALGKNYDNYMELQDNLEEKISVFYVQDIDEACRAGDGGDDFGSENGDLEEKIIYWETQEALLQEILERNSLTGQKLRQEVMRIVELSREREFCRCSKPSSNGGCTHCLRRLVVNLLRDKGFNASLCTSQWKRTKKYPGGRHEYIEILTIASGRTKQLPLVVELEFRDQFEIAKACDEYGKLVAQLPEFYIGKPKYLSTIVRILCEAAKKSLKEKKIHMGPWRKRSFMEMKWSYSLKQRSVDESLNNLISPGLHENRLHLSAAPIVIVT
ncbi:uncharacterized protein LOC116121398 [Pistacia vera]|uniref:Uncharacterized protein n=1 Tax=Pistacia atlantica TaxID=434234 RepID=A0ACC1AD44_9ROSI|nr:uncharacterized protein LOC116107002 [Pistacia vera]XP_031263214.1 uncharacterized protein LOC116121398 [Pistacia vera]KAJ0085158.1 hypothetical protein Patl1_07663 [Pistacia atlantica]